MFRSIILIAVLFAGALPITGVAQDTDSSAAMELVGKTWTLVALQGQEVSARPALTIEFENSGAIRGSSGCSEYESTYSVDGAAAAVQGDFADVEVFFDALLVVVAAGGEEVGSVRFQGRDDPVGVRFAT